MKILDRFRLDGRIALVTGAAGGIGAATAGALAEAGAVAVVADIDLEAAKAAAARLRENDLRAEAAALDVTDENAVQDAVSQILARHGRIDILVNNAGVSIRGPLANYAVQDWERVLAINLTGVFLCTRAVGPGMLARGNGAIVNVASIMGLTAGGRLPNPAYHATKGAVVNFTRSAAVEWAPRGVRVNAVAPTYARTPLTERMLADAENEAYILTNTPMGRLVTPEEVAAAIVFLAGDAAAMITGVILPVDGGWVAR